jgi:hypothetical protein
MVVKMREGDHKHRQAGRQAGRHVTGHLHHMICTSLLSISLHHCHQELEPKKPGFVQPSTHSWHSSHTRADMGQQHISSIRHLHV